MLILFFFLFNRMRFYFCACFLRHCCCCRCFCSLDAFNRVFQLFHIHIRAVIWSKQHSSRSQRFGTKTINESQPASQPKWQCTNEREKHIYNNKLLLQRFLCTVQCGISIRAQRHQQKIEEIAKKVRIEHNNDIREAHFCELCEKHFISFVARK